MIQALVERTARFRSAAFYALLPVSGISFATGRNPVALVSVPSPPRWSFWMRSSGNATWFDESIPMSPSPEELKAEIEALAALDEIDAATRANREEILGLVKIRVSPEVYSGIEECISDSDHTHSFSIVDEPCGTVQSSDYVFGDYHVDQYDNGGISGDNFAGSICIPIGQGQFLQFHYEM
uniref:hypothetical protein n=1 Tax=Burkholderia sp. M701 TaxID=326454 RepID=UPI0012EB858B|nr:hypothetical protein [Burkholderia sp. M701]